jgi:signal peptidase II
MAFENLIKSVSRYFSSKTKAQYFVMQRASAVIIKLILADQVLKWWILSYLPTVPGRVWKVSSFFDIVYVWNHGISFGILSDYYQYCNYAFVVINFFIVGWLIFQLLKQSTISAFYGYCMVIGGALGNLADRIFKGAVFDFISLHYGDVFWFPVFNLADALISLGVILILYGSTIKSTSGMHKTESPS